MGRLFIQFDPEYDRLEETGMPIRYTGRQFVEKISAAADKDAPQSNFWNPPNTEYALPLPRQFSPTWYDTAAISDYLIRKANWTLATGTAGAKEYPSTRNTLYYRTRFFVPASGVTTLQSYNFANLAAAANVTLPSDTKVVATMTTAPNGDTLGPSDGSNLHPHLTFRQYPAPQEFLIFGWGQCAVLFTAQEWFFLRSPENDKDAWELVKSGKFDQDGERPTTSYYSMGAGDRGTPVLNPVDRSFMAVPVGEKDLWISFGPGRSLTLKDFSDGSGTFFQEGPWWLATPPTHTVDAVVQLVGYQSAGTDVINPPSVAAIKELFNLGPSYKPTLDPVLSAKVWMHRRVGTEVFDVVSTAGVYTVTVTGGTPASTEEVSVKLKDEAYADWASDGTHFNGTIRMLLRPDTAQTPGYLAPQLEYLTVVFPQKVTPRAHNTYTIDDTQFAALKCSTSLRDPNGKRLSFIVFDKDGSIKAEGFDKRTLYPVHILEDTDDDDEGDLIIARGWVDTVSFREVKQEASDGGDPLRFYVFQCRGLMMRMDEGWLNPPNIVNPNSLDIEHTFAIQQAFREASFDVTDTALFDFFADPWTGTAIAKLPQGIAFAGLVDGGSHHPDWNEAKSKYVERIAVEWRGWLPPYETETQFRYHPDLMNTLRAAVNPHSFYTEGTLYRTKAAAVSAGTPMFCMLANPEPECETLPLECNAVRISGKDPGSGDANPNVSKHVIDKDTASISDITADNFVGDVRVHAVVSKLGISVAALRQLARVIRVRRSRRITRWTVHVPFAPHQIEDALCEVGRVWLLAGRGAILIDSLEWTILSPSVNDGVYVARTRISGEELPSAATEEEAPGDYPGQGVAPP